MSEKKEKKKSLLPKMEMLIILVFLMSFLVWAITKCNTGKVKYRLQDQTVENEVETDSTQAPEIAVESSETGEDLLFEEQNTILYVTINGLKVRKEPNLEGTVVSQLKLHDEVVFMDEVTDFKQEINLGLETANEPWIKVRTQKGHIGWVYGAGVHYYKMKHKGVLE
ncbi:MAG: SH3 domain-containing protein [Bacteroidetes bacterium]|nr:SH3 domain-containing protein [Bacteroidota bacterium]